MLFLILMLIITGTGWHPLPTSAAESSVPEQHLRIHYEGDGEGLGLWIWDDVAAPSQKWPTDAIPFSSDQMDSFGSYIDVPLKEGAKKVGFLIVDPKTEQKDGGNKAVLLTNASMNEVWVKRGADTVYPYEPVTLPENTVRIHYTRSDDNYSNYGVWLWEDVATPSGKWPVDATPFENSNRDRYGAYIDVPLKQDASKLGFLIVNPSDEKDKDGGDKFFHLLKYYKQLWIKENDPNVYISPYGELATGLLSAKVTSEEQIQLRFSRTEGITETSLLSDVTVKDHDGRKVEVKKAELVNDVYVNLTAHVPLDKMPLSVTYSGITVSASSDWQMIDARYTYEGNDLGANYTPEKVTFKIWSPTATSVTLNVYDKDDASLLIGSRPLTIGEKGVWEAQVKPSDLNVADLKGYFYQYEIVNEGVRRKVLDPYAKSMAAFQVDTTGKAGPDGDTVGKAAIVDLEGTNPEGYNFARIDGYEKREDAVIWELHVRDFTSDPSIEDDFKNTRWGSYAAVKQKLDYVKSLGVTHIQLLPIMAWYYGDETKMGERETDYSASGNEYNWGYDPHNYFSPDGAYSEDPTDPEMRIRETKEMIDAIHDAGMGVILDVVYTHMSKADLLNDIVTNYYAWQDEAGKYVGGFGNNLATNHAMAEKLMVDSVKYWFDEYKIDGMRFDMMGDATYDSIQKSYDAAAKLNPNALFIGEGWRTFSGAVAEPSLAGQGADQDWMDQTDDVGVFSDEIRNELKSGFGSEGEPRFITGGARDINLILNNIKGQPTNTPADDPGDMVQYIEAHDNLPLYDVIAQSIKKDPAVPENDLEIHQRIRLGNLMVLTSQGTAFLHAGQEYGRTKQWLGPGVPNGTKFHALKDESGHVFGYFIHDSYDSSDAINKFDWIKAENKQQYPVNNVTKEYTAGLIKLRKSTNAFRLGEKQLVDRNVSLISAPEMNETDLVIAYKNQSTDQTGDYYVFFNADKTKRKLTLPMDLTKGTVVVDNDEAGTTQVLNPSGFDLTSDSITIEPLSAVIIKMKSSSEGTPSVPGQPAVPGSEEKWEQQLTKLLTSLPSNPKTAVKEIMSVIQPVLTVTQYSTKVDNTGTTQVTPDSAALNKAYERLQKAWEQISKLSSTQNKELMNAIQQELQIVIDAKAATGESISILMPTSYVEQVERLSAGIKYITGSGSVSLPAGTLDAKEFITKGSFVLTLSKASASSLKQNTVKTIGDGVTFTLKVIQNGNGGAMREIQQFTKPVLLEGLYKSEQITNLNKTGWYLQSADQKLHYISGVKEAQINTFETNQTGTYFMLESIKTFRDIGQSYAKDAIEMLAARQIVNGLTEEKFAPKMSVTRGQLAVILGRALTLPEETTTGNKFKDVGSNQYYSGYVNALSSIGIVKGDPTGKFRPDENISREDMITALMNAYEYKTGQRLNNIQGTEEATFSDLSQVSAYAQSGVKAAKALGIIEGNGGKFQPKAVANREQLAKITLLFLKSTEEVTKY